MKRIFFSLTLVLGLVGIICMTAQPAYASGIDEARRGANRVRTGGSNSNSVNSLLATVTNVMLFIAGAIAVIMIVVGGIKYVTSNGNSERINSAKNTIMYAVVGLVIAIAAYAVVDFVIDQL